MVIHVHILPDIIQNTVGNSKLSIKSFELQKRSVSASPTRTVIAVCNERLYNMVCVLKHTIKSTAILIPRKIVPPISKTNEYPIAGLFREAKISRFD